MFTFFTRLFTKDKLEKEDSSFFVAEKEAKDKKLFHDSKDSYEHLYRQRYFNPKKKDYKTIKRFFSFLGLFIILSGSVFVVYKVISSRQKTKSLEIKPEDMLSFQEIEEGFKKLELPIFGHELESVHSQSPKNASALPHEKEFDFSILDNMEPQRIPILPKRYTQKEKLDEFDEIIRGTSENEYELDITAKEYEKLSYSELKKYSEHFIPLWKKNAVPFRNEQGFKKFYAVVVNYNPKDINPDNLPKIPLTLAIETGQPNIKEQASDLKQNGFELLIQLGMELPAFSRYKTGISPLKKDMDYTSLKKVINWHHNQVEHHIGFKNLNPSELLADQDIMNFVVSLFKDKGLSYVESIPPKKEKINSITYSIAESIGIPAIEMHKINDLSSEMDINIKNIYKKGFGSILIDGTAENMALLMDFIQRYKDTYPDMTIVPLTTIYKQKMIEKEKHNLYLNKRE